MKFIDLTYRNISHFARYYKLVAVAVLIAVMVIVGSLVVGDSVRMTLVKRVAERLGDTETIIFSRNSFMAGNGGNATLFGETARGILLTNGFISQNGKLTPIMVWGVDDMSIAPGAACVNTALLKKLGTDTPEALVLRLPASGLIPSGSLFVTENYTTSMRLAFEGTVSVEEGGNLSMKNEQVIPLNIFVDRRELAEVMEVEGKINLILTSNKVTADELEQAWSYAASGLSVTTREGFTEISSDRVFLQDEVVATLTADNPASNRLFSYLANSIELNDASIPYSFVTALDNYKGETLQKDEIILSDYSAKRLQAREGDHIRLTYFTSHDLKTLRTDTLSLRVTKILPLAELQKDSTLSAEFPGLSDVERCTEWDSDLPINMNLITDEDEKYWELYRSTPKAIIAYDAVANDWGNAYGNATAIRISLNSPPAKGEYPVGGRGSVDLSGLRATMFGIQTIHPREAGLCAARNGVDFSSLFLALGFFIVIAAILLMLIPLSEMLYKRRSETDLLKALGYTRKRIASMLWRESAPVVLAASIAGVVGGLLYTVLIMWLLGNVWKGATHTDGFSVYPGIATILAGLIVGILLSLFILRLTIVRNLKEKKTVKSSRKKPAASGSFNLNKLVWSTLLSNCKQAILSFFALAIGVHIVFTVGLNRRGFADSSQIRTGTGGYTLWCESSVPVYHNMMTDAGRGKLSLTDLPAGTQVLQCLRHSADDASCLNLNKVTTPTVLGVDMNALSESDFRIEQSLHALDRADVFKQMQTKTDTVYPALIDATVLTWSLMMNLGDTLRYTNDRGQEIAIQLVGTLSNSIFQGHILIDRTLFSDIWEETTGSEVFLLKTAETEKEEVRTLLAQALNEYGVRVTTTNDRLKQFNTVTDTYLTIFLTLGSLGLLLGIMAFVVVIRKNLAMRRREIILYRTLGFTDSRIEQILYRENLIVPLGAIATGLICSFAAVSLSFMNTGIWIWLLALLFAVFFVVCVVVFVRRQVKQEIKSTYQIINHNF